MEQAGYSITVILTSNSTYSWIEAGEDETTTDIGTWSVYGKTIMTVDTEGPTFTFDYTFAGNELLAEFGIEYTFQFPRQ